MNPKFFAIISLSLSLISTACMDGEWTELTTTQAALSEKEAATSDNPSKDGPTVIVCGTSDHASISDQASDHSDLPTIPAIPCPPNVDPPSDPFNIEAAVIKGNRLIVDVSANGGCAEHTFMLCASRTFSESQPVGSTVLIGHDDGDDPCDGVIEHRLIIDLQPIQAAYLEQYKGPTGSVSIQLIGLEKALLYTF